MDLPPLKSGEGSSADPPRPSLARTSVSTQASPRSSFGMSERSDDIRGDLAAGWGSGPGSRGGAAAAGGRASDDGGDPEDGWGWRLRGKAVRPVPPFYPMDPRSVRRIALSGDLRGGEGGDEEMKMMEEDASDARHFSIEGVSNQISRACQSLSIYAIWDNNCPSATLSSMERVEMEITFYLGNAAAAPSQQSSPQVLLVEVQRRKGCSITFHNYRRCLLDAAEGKFDPASFHKTDGLDKPLGRERNNQPRPTLGRPGLARPTLSRGGSSGLCRPSLARPSLSPPASPSDLSPPSRPRSIARPSPFRPGTMGPPSPGAAGPGLRSPSFSADDAAAPIAGLKTEGEGSPGTEVDARNEALDKALKALNMAASLIKKDRVDARRLGMESLVLLTDPLRAGMETAKIASRVVLLGSANEDDVRLEDGEDDIDALFDESAGLGIRETILEMLMADNDSEKMASEDDGYASIEKEFTDTLFNLCLTVLSNALHTIEEIVKLGAAPASGAVASSSNRIEQEDSPGESPGSPRRRAATEPAVLPSGVPKRFIDDTNSTFGVDVLSSLIRILGQAKTNPHDAYHSARCLGVLFKGCGNSHKARARRDLDAKRIIAAALEVGSRSHAKLEDASRVAMMALVTDDEESVGEEGEGENTEMENERLEEETEERQLHDRPCIMEQSMSADSDER